MSDCEVVTMWNQEWVNRELHIFLKRKFVVAYAKVLHPVLEDNVKFDVGTFDKVLLKADKDKVLQVWKEDVKDYVSDSDIDDFIENHRPLYAVLCDWQNDLRQVIYEIY
jgi:hypothetical protein